LNLKRETAAQLIAEDRKTDQQIAEIVGVSRRTVESWKHRPAIKKRIAEICDIAASRLDARMVRHEWLWERDCLRRQANTSKSPVARRVAVEQLREMGAL
jgi:transposase